MTEGLQRIWKEAAVFKHISCRLEYKSISDFLNEKIKEIG
jgi:hypothetical protein